jgi:hypothetical protein
MDQRQTSLYVDTCIHYRIPMWTPLSHDRPGRHPSAFCIFTSHNGTTTHKQLRSHAKKRCAEHQFNSGVRFDKQSPQCVRAYAFEAPTTESPLRARCCARICRNHLVLNKRLDVIKPQASPNRLLHVNLTQQLLPLSN